ncbi:MAG: hypothetical protein R2861_02650 [Desulfobacterales bacterium]
MFLTPDGKTAGACGFSLWPEQKTAKRQIQASGRRRQHWRSPYDIGAVSMAQRVLRPSRSPRFWIWCSPTTEKDIQMEEIPVDPASPLVNVMLKDSGIRQNST